MGPTPQILLPGSSIPQFVDPMPTLTGTVGTNNMELLVGPSYSAIAPTELFMKEFRVPVLPATTPTTPAYAGTSVFGYRLDSTTANADTYIGPVFVTSRGTPSAIKYINNLGSTRTTNLGVWKYSVDQTLHWANPNNLPMGDLGRMTNYDGPIPAVPHKHGGEEPAAIDGGPDAWFLSDPAGWGISYPTTWNNYQKHGLGYYTFGYDPATDANNTFSLYRHLNQQEAGPLWFHDHLLGGTRVNVYCGLAGAALQIDPSQTLPAGMNAVGLNNGALDLTTVLGVTGANTELTIPLVLQDRMFDTAGELYFPDIGLNPEHPFWIPEFVGDTVVVNGKSWPFLQVDPKRYRFLMINGSNARFYELNLGKNVPMYVIGTDGGYLDTPVMVNKLVIGPGERYQLIIDFGKYAGKTMVMTNTGRTPFPKGAPPKGSTLGNIVQFRVNPATAGFVDNSYNPAAGGTIRLNQPIQRLVTPPGTLNPAVAVAQNRQLTLNEVMGPGGPLEILVNNTKWKGERPTGPMGSTPILGFVSDGIGAWLSEVPAEGTTEVWEIINITADAHPIHTHLTQFQILNRQNFNVNKYMKAYNAAFPAAYDFTTNTTTAGGVFVPAYGPPMAYTSPGTPSPITMANIVGGNPDVTPFLQGMVTPADSNEAGWKDTAIMYPGQVTRIAVRYTPLDTAPATVNAKYPFTPNDQNPNADLTADVPNYDYVWHCHIVDHEDNEMMRPYQVTPAPAAVRTRVLGTDY
ncbi:MAG: multicopper oxidase domain-containing protein [Desulfobacterales bacterium]|nr:multicopper oxidase domain-containing protein [Desulfobacterales bacterium]